MKHKITPQIIIPESTINRCFDCPFFEERSGGYDDAEYYCRHPSSKDGWELMNEYRFDTIDGTSIWVNCPLPDTK